MTPTFAKHIGESGKVKLPYNRKSPQMGTGRDGHLAQPVGVRPGKQDENKQK